MAVARFQHRVEYPDNHGITLVEVADTLLAHDRVVRLLPQVLERAIPGLVIEKIDVVLVDAEEGSLLEQFGVLIWTTYQKEITEAVSDAVLALTGSPIPEEHKTVVSFIILLLFLAGAVWLLSKFSSKKDGVNIKGDYNTVLNITAGKLNLTPEQMDDIVQSAIKGPNRQALAKASQRFFRPAQRNGLGRVKLPDVHEVSREAVGEVPTDVEIEAAKEDPTSIPMTGVGVSVRATDMDRREHGWYGVVDLEERDGKRLPISLYPTIAPHTLQGVVWIKADILIEMSASNDDSVPKRIHVVHIHEMKFKDDHRD